MQVRVFIKPGQVALMLSAGDWLSDSVFVGVCVFLYCSWISFAFSDRYVAVRKSEETLTCVTLRRFWVHAGRKILSLCHTHTQFTCLTVWGKLLVICNGFRRFTAPGFFFFLSFLCLKGERSISKMFMRGPVMSTPRDTQINPRCS